MKRSFRDMGPIATAAGGFRGAMRRLALVLAVLAPASAGASEYPGDAGTQVPGPADIVAVLGRDGLLVQQVSLQAIRARLDAVEGAVATRELAESTLANVYSFQGDYLSAARVFPESLSGAGGLELPLPATGAFTARDAADVISDLVRTRHVVIINEAHHLAQTRWLPMLLLPRLRALGYEYLALEALSEDGLALARRGYADARSGSFTNEPIYAEMVRVALQLGYKLVRYDVAPAAGASGREAAQAEALAAVLADHGAQAKMLVLAGYRHASKNDDGDRGGTLATRLQRLGLDPLAVDQTATLDARVARLADSFQVTVPSILVGRDDEGWSAASRHYDLTVLLPTSVERRGRPGWLGMGGSRREHPIQGAACEGRFPCMVEARHSTDGDDAVPADRFVLRESGQRALLYLAPGRYRISVVDEANRRFGGEETVDIE